MEEERILCRGCPYFISSRDCYFVWMNADSNVFLRTEEVQFLREEMYRRCCGEYLAMLLAVWWKLRRSEPDRPAEQMSLF